MKRHDHIWKRGIALLTSAMLAAGCGSTGAATTTTTPDTTEAATETATETASETVSDHEPLTIVTRSSSDYYAFTEALHEVYPEINIERISYGGWNTTSYSNVQLQAGDVSDIFVVSYPPADTLQQENLLDLSGQDFISNLNVKTISDLSIDGAVYLMPTKMTLFAIYYNKTLFEEHGWEVPTSLAELDALVPEIEAAGVTLAETCSQYTGSMFSYFFDVNAPDYFTSLDGISWMQGYLDGTMTAAGYIEPLVDRFRDLAQKGLLNIGGDDDEETVDRFREGNTAFLIANSSQRFTQNEDGTGDEYAMMPYLSEDGSNNIVVTNMSMYVGVSKSVQDNPQKYEDAMKVMSFLATPEGQDAIVTNQNTVSPIKGEGVDKESPLYEMSLLIEQGQYMGLVYSGWEDYVVDIGEAAAELVAGEMTTEEFVTALDTFQQDVQATGGAEVIADVEEDLTMEQTAQLVGAAFAQAAGADCALISLGDWHGPDLRNIYGVNGKIYAGAALTADTISTFNPLGWSKTIQTLTLTGARIRQYVEEGYYVDGDEIPYTYLLITRDGETLDDDTTYTVAVSNESEARAAEGSLQDTGIVGQEALVQYIGSLGTINSETIQWQ